MMPMLGEQITIVSRTAAGRDSDGNDVYQTRKTTVRGTFTPAGSQELLNGRDTVITLPQVFLPAGIDINAVDAVIVRGLTYEVVGDPQEWRSPFTNWKPGVVLSLSKVTG